MANTINTANYISCPICATLFRPKVSSSLPKGQFKCICCSNIFDPVTHTSYQNEQAVPKKQIEQTSQSTQPSTKQPTEKTKTSTFQFTKKSRIASHNRARTQHHIKDQLPINVTKQKSATSNYIKYYHLRRKALLSLWLITPMMFILLSLNTVLGYKNTLAQDYKWRTYISALCDFTGCTIPTYNNLDYIQIEDNSMITTDDSENKIQLFAMLSNTAKYEQDFPNLMVKFTDLNNNIISQQLITPDMYLDNISSKKTNKLHNSSKQYISVLIDDPGIDATNYEIMLTS